MRKPFEYNVKRELVDNSYITATCVLAKSWKEKREYSLPSVLCCHNSAWGSRGRTGDQSAGEKFTSQTYHPGHGQTDNVRNAPLCQSTRGCEKSHAGHFVTAGRWWSNHRGTVLLVRGISLVKSWWVTTNVALLPPWQFTNPASQLLKRIQHHFK